MKQNNNQKVFLSYSHNDREIAEKIVEKFRDNDINIFYDFHNFLPEENIFYEIKKSYETSDSIVFLISNSTLNSEYSRELFNTDFIRQSKSRKINIFPVLIEKCNIPSDFLEFDFINLSNNFEKGLNTLISKLKAIPSISFENFSPNRFEDFIFDFLKEYNFKNIVREESYNDFKFDFQAEYSIRNPFGRLTKQKWIIETKFYSHSRIDMRFIRELENSIANSDFKFNILLVTNSLLTSVVEEYLNEINSKNIRIIEVIDGLQLKKLTARKKKLTEKYFQI